jgi:hypothetical protein
MRKKGMNAGLRFHWRLDVQSIFDAIAFLRNRKESRIHDSIKRIVPPLSFHAVPDGKIVVNIGAEEQ